MRLSVADVQQIKNDGEKIAAAVLYDVTMCRVFERAGVDVISVGDSFMSYLLGGKMEDVTVDNMLLFARGVMGVAERAAISIDVPIGVCERGPEEVAAAARKFKAELAPEYAKIYVPSGEEKLLEEIHAIADAGLAPYVRVVYQPKRAEATSAAAELEHVIKLASDVETAGAALIDLYQGTTDAYREVSKALKVPVIGGQWSSNVADGKIFVYPNFVGYRPDLVDKTDGPSAAHYIYELLKPALDEVHAATWQPS